MTHGIYDPGHAVTHSVTKYSVLFYSRNVYRTKIIIIQLHFVTTLIQKTVNSKVLGKKVILNN